MMKKLNSNELKKVKGGINLSAALIKVIISAIDDLLDVGRNIGSSFRRTIAGKMCGFK